MKSISPDVIREHWTTAIEDLLEKRVQRVGVML